MKKTVKKCIVVLIITVISFGVLPTSVFAAQAQQFEIDGITYRVISQNNEEKKSDLEVVKGSGKDCKELNIKESFKKDEVTYTVTKIGDRAFYDYVNLENVNIPKTVTEIGYKAFSGCSNLESVTIPVDTKFIGAAAFYDCDSLESIEISGVEMIENETFKSCDNLKEVSIGDGVETIGREAFYQCKNLATVTMPDSVINIGENAFFDCEALKSINMPDGLEIIENDAFSKCGLTSVEIPSSVIEIEDFAFYMCSNLNEVVFKGANPPNLGSNAFYGCHKNLIVYVPADAIENYQSKSIYSIYKLEPYGQLGSAIGSIKNEKPNSDEGENASNYNDYKNQLGEDHFVSESYMVTNINSENTNEDDQAILLERSTLPQEITLSDTIYNNDVNPKTGDDSVANIAFSFILISVASIILITTFKKTKFENK